MSKTSLILGLSLMLSAVTAVAANPKQAPNPYESASRPTMGCKIDRIVFAKLSSLDIKPVLCSDAVFVRRVYLDVIGTLPTAEEAWKFINDPNRKNKRRILIDQLLERDEFADYWSMKWGDILRIKAEFPINLWPNAAQAYHRWVRASIAENKPYDQFVREMLTSSGSNFRVGPVNFYRAIQNKTPEGIATTVALTFMGTRTDSWTKDRLAGTAIFFSQIGYKPTSEWKEEHVFWNPLGSALPPGSTAPGQAAIKTSAPVADEKSKLPVTPAAPLVGVFPDGKKVEIPPNQDPREVFADWLITPENPWYTKSIVNRVWAWLMGRGIIHEPDDIREANPPSNPELLSYLQKEFINSGYDLKHLYRLILTSNVYQLSSIPRQDSQEARANFASYPLRRLEAEVLIDAVNKITGTSDLYTSAIPEPFTYIPKDLPAIALADGSITSPFLALFGRSARATGMENERDNKPVPAQWLHMLNSSHIQSKLEQGPALKEIFMSRKPPAEIVKALYLTILSRPPTQEEFKTILEFVKSTRSRREAAVDISWALINSPEFLYRH
ncbi:MAG: DUF1553 domain-containing protein [Pirellulales bacterium]|nr:DUF1553 domain-containing protein [Pirellulales bacterium]